VGLISDPKFANDVLLNKRSDFVAIVREYLKNPNCAYDAAQLLKYELK